MGAENNCTMYVYRITLNKVERDGFKVRSGVYLWNEMDWSFDLCDPKYY